MMETVKVRHLVVTALFGSLWLLALALAAHYLLSITVWQTLASVGWVG